MRRPPVRPPDQHPSGARPPQLGKDAVPRHVAIVMDGNGRWAKSRGLPRTAGHTAGEAALFDVVEGAIEIGVQWISAYAFSTENWRRSPDEVRFLMGFNRDVIRRRRDEMNEMGVRVRWAGRRPRLWKSVIDELEQAEQLTADNRTLTLTMCVNYGGRAEIADAAAALAREVRAGRVDPDKIDREAVRQVPRRAGHAGRRPLHPFLRRAAHLQLPALAVRVRRALLHGRPVARLRPPAPLAGDQRLRPARPPLRRCVSLSSVLPPVQPLGGSGQVGQVRR